MHTLGLQHKLQQTHNQNSCTRCLAAVTTSTALQSELCTPKSSACLSSDGGCTKFMLSGITYCDHATHIKDTLCSTLLKWVHGC